MWVRGDQQKPLILPVVLALVVLLSACSTETAPPPDETPPITALAELTTTVPPTTAPPVTVSTTIPTTSVPPSTFAPPELPATTLPVPAVTTTIPEQVDAGTIVVSPEDDLAALVASSPEETRFLILPGVHRSRQAEPKDGMTFEGLEGSVLSGAVVLEDWEPTDGGWGIAGIELNPVTHGECIEGYKGCAFRNDLYVDDAMLWRVDDRSELAQGTWWSDGQQIVIGDNPAGRKVEVSLTQHAFLSDADYVTIRNLVVEKYASLAQGGAIQAQIPGEGPRGTDWLIENVETRLNHASGIRTGDRTIIRNVYSHHNGQHGITGGEGVGIVVESSEIAYNNQRGFNWGWEAGGAKFTRTEGLVLRDLTVHHNIGPGLWTDIDCIDTTYERNTVFSNAGPGIFHEISFDAVIRNNEVYNNGFIQGTWLWGAGILIAASTDVEVYDNTVTNNADGITGIQQDRSGDNGPALLQNVHVHHNTITMWYGTTGVAQDTGDSSVFTDRNIVFEDNTFVAAGHDDAFAWNNSFMGWEDWQRTGQGAGSTRSDG